MKQLLLSHIVEYIRGIRLCVFHLDLIVSFDQCYSIC